MRFASQEEAIAGLRPGIDGVILEYGEQARHVPAAGVGAAARSARLSSRT